ncbi:MAG TPA: FHA domain-containing protein, partial [Gemmatimonadales bacterium]|nr:FHA domain-containing protein [Gemmatimonadales bacterium]
MPYRLVSLAGDQTFELPPGRSLVVGRGVSSDIAIYDPTISRRHAELTVGADGVRVKDLGSSNGTCINGTRVSSGRLTPNDSITFGKVLFQLKDQKGSGEPQGAGMPLPSPPVPGDMIVRQLMVSGGGPPGITTHDRPSGLGQLRVAAATAEERQAKKLSLLLDIAQKLSGEFDLDKLLRNVVDMMFEVMNVDRVTIVLRN